MLEYKHLQVHPADINVSVGLLSNSYKITFVTIGGTCHYLSTYQNSFGMVKRAISVLTHCHYYTTKEKQ